MIVVSDFMKHIGLILVLCSAMSVARADYAAIYFDRTTGIAGAGYHVSSKEKAAAEALATCQKNSGKKYCEEGVIFNKECFAAAWSPKNKRIVIRGTRSDNYNKASLNWAEAIALKACKRGGGDPNCQVVSSACAS